MAAAVHRVRRQSWRVTVRSAHEAFALRGALRAELEDTLLPAFGQAFDEAAPGEAIVHIPRLELRLRVASLDQLGTALREALGRELRMCAPTPPRPVAADWHQLLLGYLDGGTLAWHAAHRDPSDAAARMRAALLAALDSIARDGPARGAPFARRVQFYFRLLQLLPEDRWPEFAKHLPGNAGTASHDPPAPTVEAALAALLRTPPSLPRHAVHRLAAAALAVASDSQPAAPALREALAAFLDGGPRDAGRVLATWFAALPAPAAGFFAARLEVAPFAGGRSSAARRPQAALAPQPVREQHAPEEVPLRSDAHTQAPQTFAIAAGNAGLVLLHPFLPQLFESCDLYRRPHWASLPRAAALLHWLATGRDEAHEFELGFAKLLLGLRPDTPLPVGAGLLGGTERDEGAALLRAAIGHWKALRNTTIAGLRVAFLQRRGALREEQDGWGLRLEPEAYDVLLGQLPWSLATVRLPWMTRPLYTNWPTP